MPTTQPDDLVVSVLPGEFARWDDLLALIRRSFAYMDGVIDPPSSVHRLTPALLRRKALDEHGLLAWIGGELAGCAFVARRSGSCYLGKLAVEPKWQGHGVGRALVAAAEAYAIGCGAVAMELETRVELVDNHAAFARLGYREIARTMHPGYSRVTSLTLRKTLA